MSNPSVIQAYENYQPTTIALTHVGNGVYTASGYTAKVTGVYKIVYKANATSARLGEIQRTEEQSLNVRFPSLNYELKRSKVGTSRDNETYYHTVILQPSYKDCNGATKLVTKYLNQIYW